MKQFSILLALFVAFASNTQAQTSLTEAVDFTVTDIHGVEHTLFDYLDAGKYVCVDFLFTTCGPCQANQPFFTETYHNYGCNEGDVIFISLETTVGDAETEAYEQTFGGDNPPPIVSCTDGGGCDAAGPYGIGAFPTFILIAPDHSIVEQDMWPLSNGAATFTQYFDAYGLQQMACVVDVEAVESGSRLTAMPNPAAQQMQLSLEGFQGVATIQVTDLSGRVIYQGSTAHALSMLDVSNWSNGVYAVQVTDGMNTERQTVVVAH
jgi:thiol-disulfide isomerase/thioredoxin